MWEYLDNRIYMIRFELGRVYLHILRLLKIQLCPLVQEKHDLRYGNDQYPDCYKDSGNF